MSGNILWPGENEFRSSDIPFDHFSQCRLLDYFFNHYFRFSGGGSQKYFFHKKIDLALSSPRGVGLGAADRKIRDLHVRGFCHSSSEYISNGSESESKQMEFKHGGFIVSNNLKCSNLRSQENNL